VIDKNNNIRFKSVGNSHSEAELIEELAIMIEMCKMNKVELITGKDSNPSKYKLGWMQLHPAFF
jgi:hypothetical protein